MKTKHVVIDTAAFVKNLPLWEYGENLYSVPDVVREIRDKQTREWYDSLPVTITMREPQAWAIKYINQFSKKTGDFASLSLADVKLLALTYELEVEQKGSSDHLRSEPLKTVTEGPIPKENSNGQPSIEGFHVPSENPDCSLTNSSDNPLSEYLSEDEESNTSYSSSLELSSDDIPKANQRHDLPYALPSCSLYTSKNSLADSRLISCIYWCHMLGLENFLKEHSYIGGYNPTSDDCNLWNTLIKEYPQFCPSPEDKYSSVFSALKLPPITTHRPLHSTFPCIRRWSYHIASFSLEERSQFPSSDRNLEDILHDFGGRSQNGKDECPVPDLVEKKTPLLESALVVDMNALTFVDQEISSNIEDGNSDGEEECSSVEDDNCHYDGDCEDAQENIECEVEECQSDDDNDGWITPSNIKHHKLKNNNNMPVIEDKDKNVLVACITADFAMQNILRHIGLPVMGVDGKLIWQIRTFILRCYACFKTTSNMAKIFCPNCGNKTLKRVSVTVNPDGTQKIWINYRKPINTKGMIFSLPKPKGGQHARNPILVSDQKEVRQFSSKMSKKKINPLHEDYDPDAAPFAIRDVYSRASQLGYIAGKCHNHYYWERKNPNVHVKKYKKKK